jgi:glucan 1,3-beta-glucosidase
MAPQKPRSRPTSGNPSPAKTPRQSTDRRKSASPTKRSAVDPEQRQSQASEKRRSQISDEKRASYASDRDRRRSTASSPRKGSPRKRSAVADSVETPASSNVLSVDSLAKLNEHNEKESAKEKRAKEKVVSGRVSKERQRSRRKKEAVDGEKKRRTGYISAASLDGRLGKRGGFLAETSKKKKLLCLLVCLVILLLIILIPVGVLVIGKQNNGGNSAGALNSTDPGNGNLDNITEADIPGWAQGTYFDPFTWYDTDDFNVTVTNETVGGLPVMGLFSNWDDSVQANENVPPLDKKFNYGSTPIRGVNLGGWLSLEPFITPSMFNAYSSNLGIVDEYTLTQHLGPSVAASTLEKHYSTFINKQTFIDVRNAGFDHVRIPYSYWAVTTYPGDPYVPKISWRYLLRGIEYARQNGIRVNLDLHAVPGSQNGWNHSGRQGTIGWLNGTDGALNGERSIAIHNQLSQFFAQPRYKNVVGIYGLVNEPKMISLPTETVLNWTVTAITTVRNNNLTQAITFGDGFLGLPNWQGKLQGIDNIVMDAHQYVIFNTDQVAFSHQTKLSFACSGWANMMSQSINTATG